MDKTYICPECEQSPRLLTYEDGLREARLEEAKWWAFRDWSLLDGSGRPHDSKQGQERIAALESALACPDEGRAAPAQTGKER